MQVVLQIDVYSPYVARVLIYHQQIFDNFLVGSSERNLLLEDAEIVFFFDD